MSAFASHHTREQCDCERREARREDGNRQQQGSVDDDQDDEHSTKCHGEEDSVDAGEPGSEVGGEARRPSHVRGHTGRRGCVEGDFDLVEYVTGVGIGADGHEGL